MRKAKNRDRFTRNPIDPRTLKPTKRRLDILEEFNSARILTANTIGALHPFCDDTARNRHLTKNFDAGLMGRRTFDGHNDYYETFSYWRTEAGKQYLARRRKAFSDYNTAQDEEQTLIDLADAGIRLGACGTDVEFIPWHLFREHELTPQLPKNPHTFEYDGHQVTYDGHPFSLKRGTHSFLFFKEVIRTNKWHKTIGYKVRAWNALLEDVRKRFNVRGVRFLWITTSAHDKRKVLNCIKDEIGPCRWMLVHLMEDHIAEYKNTPSIPTHLFTEPWERVGFPPFSMHILSEA